MFAVILSENAWTIILVIVAIAILVPVSMYFSKKRAQALEKAAAEMGFTFERKGAAFLGELDKNLHLLGQGRGRTLSNVLRGPNGVALFDYRYQSATADYRTRKVISQTVAAFPFPSATLPEFFLGPEHWWHKAAGALGYQMIRFDTHPAFSKRYLLRGPDENAVRVFFMPPLLDYLQALPEQPAWCVEAAGHWLLLYQPKRTIKAPDLRSFADATTNMVREIATRAGIHR